MTDRVIVVGNGMAGVAVLDELASGPQPPRMTVFGAEPHPGYNRIALSDILASAKNGGDAISHPRGWYEERGITLHAGTRIDRIDPQARTVLTEAGSAYEYDRLLLATGAEPVLPPIRGVEKTGVFTFRTLEDTEAMIRWAGRNARAVVVGGGLLGLEAARGLTNRGMVVTVFHLADHLMEQQLDAASGAMLLRRMERMGIRVRVNCTVTEVIGGEAVEAVRLSTGDALDADMVLVTVGIRPNVRLANEAGLVVNRGVIVDDTMLTSDPRVWAVGECVEHEGRTYGLVAPLLEQAKVAADAIAGSGHMRYRGTIAVTRLKVAGVDLVSMGSVRETPETDRVVVISDAVDERYRKVLVARNRVVGAVFLGDETGVQPITDLLLSGDDASNVATLLLDSGAAAGGSVAEMVDSSVVCTCHGVTKGDLVQAIRQQRCQSRGSIAACTKATTGCGGCAGLVDELLAAYGEGERDKKAPGKIEIMKAAKPGLDVLADLHRYAAEGWETISEDDVQRLKWYGVFLRTPTPGFFMVRVRIPNGLATSDQFRTFARIAREFGRNTVDLTTRQQVQLRWLTIDRVPEILDLLRASGLSTLQTGMDNVRNVMGCPVTGLSPTELLDTAGISRALTDRFIGKPEFANLPRKLNVSITGCREHCLHDEAQDLAMTPATTVVAGETLSGFNVAVGGKQGSGGFRPATPLDVFVTPDEAVDVACALILLFRDHGSRDSRTRSRLAFLVDDWGAPRVRAELERRMGRPLSRGGADARQARRRTNHVGVFRQRQAGLNYVGLSVPVGRLEADQLTELARLADDYGIGELRLTADQNVILPHVPDAKVGRLVEDEPLLKVLRYDPSEISRGLVACPGAEHCGLALIETKGRALALTRSLEQRISVKRPVSIHWSGCPSACGNHLMADIGLLGKRIKLEGQVIEAVDIFVGGRSGAHAQAGRKIMEDVPCEALEPVLEGLVRFVAREKAVETVRGDAPVGTP